MTSPVVGTQLRGPGSQAVVVAILGYLRERRLQPGDRLPSERDFAERLGVGRNAVREALAMLVTLRVVASRPNSGIYLRHVAREASFEALVMLADLGEMPTADEVAQSMAVRAPLEHLAVRLACEQRTPADLARLELSLARSVAVLASQGNLAEADTDFHLAVAEATHNMVLVRVLNAFYQFTARRRSVMFADLAQGQESVAEHQALLACIRSQDVAAASDLMTQHMDRARLYWGVAPAACPFEP